MRYFPCFNHTVFIACRFKGNHIVIGAEEADRVIYGCPLGVQADVFGRHGLTDFMFASGEASRRIIPSAEGIRILFQSRRVIRNDPDGVRVK